MTESKNIMMNDIVNQLKLLVSENEIEKALERLRNIFSLSKSGLETDIYLISAQLNKLKKEALLGTITLEEDNVRHTRITKSILSLIEEISKNPKLAENYKNIKEDFQGDALEKLNIKLSQDTQEALLGRLTYIKSKNISIKGLWIDDNTQNPNYIKLFSSIGIDFDFASSSEQAINYLEHNNDYELIISDITRNQNSKEGIEFVSKIVGMGFKIPPVIFFTGRLNPTIGTPPHSFGITNVLANLFHYVMDVIERKY